MLLAPLAFPAVPDLGRGLLIWDCSKKARLSSETLRYLVRVDTKEARADSYGEHARAFYVEQMQMVNLWRQVSPTSRLARCYQEQSNRSYWLPTGSFHSLANPHGPRDVADSIG
jgi:hypothetical protein